MSIVDHDELYAFKTLRHFPELRQSVSNLHDLKVKTGRNFKPTHAETFREVQLKTTHGLEELTHSSLVEISALSQFRKTLLADRQIARELMKQNDAGIAATRNSMAIKVLDPLASATGKIARASLSFAGSGGGTTALQVFRDTKFFTKDDFIDQIRRSLNVNLTPAEQQAFVPFIISLSKKSDENSIDSISFIRYFLKVGTEARDEIKTKEKSLEIQHRKEALEAENQFVEQNTNANDNATNGSYGIGFSEGNTLEPDTELNSALEKLSQTAINWDNSSFIESVCTSGFEAYLTPAEFKIQLEKSFGIKLTNSEVQALMEKYLVSKEATPCELGTSSIAKKGNMVVEDGVHTLPRYYNKPMSSFRRDLVAKQHKHGAKSRATLQDTSYDDSKLLSHGSSRHMDAIDKYVCIDGHKFLKDFLSGSTIKKPAEALAKEQRAIFQKRRDRVNEMGQNCDFLPKVLGR